MKRGASQAFAKKQNAQRRKKFRAATGLDPTRMYGPVRAYPGSIVPLASRGYRLNPHERKVADYAATQYDVNSSGDFKLLAVPVLGTDMNNRIGRKILLKSVYIRGHVSSQYATTAATGITLGQLYRMIIFIDLQPNGAAPATTDLLVTAAPQSHLNLNNRDRFKILCDKQWTVDPYFYSTTASASVASASRQIWPVKKYKKLNIETVFNATNGGTIADIASGALYMFWIGSSGTGNADGIASVSTRVRFSDM